MVGMKGMSVAVVDIVHMVTMLHGFVPTAGAVSVLSQAMFGRLLFGGHLVVHFCRCVVVP